MWHKGPKALEQHGRGKKKVHRINSKYPIYYFTQPDYFSRDSKLVKKERKFVEWHVMQCNGLFTINYLMQCVDN